MPLVYTMSGVDESVPTVANGAGVDQPGLPAVLDQLGDDQELMPQVETSTVESAEAPASTSSVAPLQQTQTAIVPQPLPQEAIDAAVVSAIGAQREQQ